MQEVLYNIPTDGSTFVLRPNFAPKTLTFVNASDKGLLATSETGHVIQIGATEGGPVPVPPARQWSIALVSAATVGSCWVFASDRRIPGAVGGLSAAGGGGGGPVTIADGAAVNLGSLADAAWASGNGTITAILKRLANLLAGTLTVGIAAGANLIGTAKLVDSAGTNLLAIDASGRLSVLGITNALPAGTNLLGGIQGVAAGNAADTQVSIATTTTLLLAARATRKLVTVENLDAANPVYINSGAGAATVAASFRLAFGASYTFTHNLALQGISTGGAVNCAVHEEWF